MAAHPDDEKYSFLSAMPLKAWVYALVTFSLTRGDGGQNLIGKEVSELLGMIRTQELQMARKNRWRTTVFSPGQMIFGYSKHPDETLTIWEKEKNIG